MKVFKCMYNVLTLLAISIVGGESCISASKGGSYNIYYVNIHNVNKTG